MASLLTRATATPRVSIISDIPTLDSFADCEPGDWQCFAAAVASTDTRRTILKDLATWVNETPTNRPLTDLYDTVTGKYVFPNQSSDIRIITNNVPAIPATPLSPAPSWAVPSHRS